MKCIKFIGICAWHECHQKRKIEKALEVAKK
jgi:hypothetical protein